MEAKFINPVLTSMVNVLSTMAKLNLAPGKPCLKQDDKALGVVTGIMAMEGSQAKGSLAISFPEEVILDIYKRMLHQEKTEVDDMAKDLAGEIANMVIGGAKKILLDEGYDFGYPASWPVLITLSNTPIKAARSCYLSPVNPVTSTLKSVFRNKPLNIINSANNKQLTPAVLYLAQQRCHRDTIHHINNNDK